jgi:hypothetical protein
MAQIEGGFVAANTRSKINLKLSFTPSSAHCYVFLTMLVAVVFGNTLGHGFV